MGRLNKKTALITGAASGIGRATAERFVEEGAKVVVADINDSDGQALIDVLGANASFFHLDVTSKADWSAAVDHTIENFGGLDVLVNNAGYGGVYFMGIEDVELEEAEKILDINVLGTLLGIQTVTPFMASQGFGSIINLSSANGLLSANGLATYCASKWAVRGLTKSAALELGPRGIRVNSILPGGADTPMGNVGNVSREEFGEGMREWPMGRACDPAEIAEGIIFFASDSSSFCAGAELVIDGGLTAGVYYKGLPGGIPER